MIPAPAYNESPYQLAVIIIKMGLNAIFYPRKYF